MYTSVRAKCSSLVASFNEIRAERKDALHQLVAYIKERQIMAIPVALVVICTHNSRRSHLGQIWLAVAAEFYQVHNVRTYSGGTEATALNPRVVKMLSQDGFVIQKGEDHSINPRYDIRWSDNHMGIQAFSKIYNHKGNSSSNFAAIMVCDGANESCPFIPGCDIRVSLPYVDPKLYDDSKLEEVAYQKTSEIIAREMLYVMSQCSSS